VSSSQEDTSGEPAHARPRRRRHGLPEEPHEADGREGSTAPASERPGSTAELSGATTELPGSTAELPGSTAELSGVTTEPAEPARPADAPAASQPPSVASPVEESGPDDPGDPTVPVGLEAAVGPVTPADPADPAEASVPAGSTGPDAASAAVDAEARTDEQHAKRVWHWREQSRKRNARAKRPWWIELPILIVIAFVLTFLIQTFVARVYYVPSGSMEHTLHGTTSGGDRILAFKMLYDFRDPEQGEVVVFKGPATWTPEANIPGPSSWIGKAAQALGSVVGIAPPNEKDYVKRVIAVGGQTIRCCDAKGRVQVNGTSLNEPYLFMEKGNPTYAQWEWIDGQDSCEVDPENPTRYRSIRCFGPYTVPKGMVWVMGDHRPDSADSSYNCRGLVPSSQVHCQGPIPVDDVIGKAVAIVMPPSRWGSIGSPDIMAPSGGALGAAMITMSPTGTLPAAAPFALGLLGAVGVRQLRRRRWRGR
jgi:signal peptidase I